MPRVLEMQANDSLANFLTTISAGGDGLPISIEDAQQRSNLSRAGVLKRFRQLQESGEGYLRLGRHGHPTRFYFRSKSTAKAAPLERAVLQLASAGSQPWEHAPRQAAGEAGTAPPSEAADLVSHHYQLRQGMRITLQLPSDLTEREAGRLARFIETLPL